MRVAIIGLGLIGGSLAMALRRARPEWELIGDDHVPETMQQAVRGGLVQSGDIRTADIVVLAVPIPAFPKVLAGLSGSKAVITDVASTKTQVMAWAEAAGVDLIGGHPMAGRERGGLEMAKADLFEHAPWVLTREQPKLLEMIRAVGAVPLLMEFELHDEVIAGVSHLGFVLSAAYMLALAKHPRWEQMAQLTGPGFQGMTRLMLGDPCLPSAIAKSNCRAMIQILTTFEAELTAFRKGLEAEGESVGALFSEAHQAAERFATVKDEFINQAGRGRSNVKES
ncbi:MAG: prephenate dehydrogenase [Candidatus Dormibacteraceae bacterium]